MNSLKDTNESNAIKGGKKHSASIDLASAHSALIEAASNVSMIATDTQGVIQVFNSGAEAMLGYSKEEVCGKETPLLFHDLEEIKSVARELELSLDDKSPFEIFKYAAQSKGFGYRHWRYVSKAKKELSVLLKLSEVRDDERELIGYLGVAVDVTDDITIQREVELQESRLRALFELSPVGIALNDFETGQFLEGNKKLIEPTGYSEIEFTQLSYFDLTPEEGLVEQIGNFLD